MAANCGASLAKGLLIFFNVIVWLGGAAVIGIGIWMLVDPDFKDYLAFMDILDNAGVLLDYAAYVMIAIGVFAVTVAFCGGCGAYMESKCLLGTYIGLLAIVMLGELAAGILILIYRDKLLDKSEQEFQESLAKYYVNDPNAPMTEEQKLFTDTVNFFQQNAECCGWLGPLDFNSTIGTIPPSCCVLKEDADTDCTILQSHVENYDQCKVEGLSVPAVPADVAQYCHTKSCKDDLADWFEDHGIILIAVAIGVGALELFGFIFAICLCRNLE